MRKIWAIPLIFICVHSWAQQTVQYDPEVLKFYKEGISYFESENYAEANRSFRKTLAINKVLPSDLSYYFAETLYHLGQYQNSKNFIEKYLTLTGYNGDFYNEANNLEDLLNEEFNKILNCPRCNDFGYRLIPCDHCGASGLEISTCYQCKGLGNSLCPKCTGRGVVIYVDSFGQKHYQECDICEGVGYVTCELCGGTKLITRTCSVCFGEKVKASSVICNHTDDQEELFEKKKLR